MFGNKGSARRLRPLFSYQMPRFTEEAATCLKRKMLARSPEFMLSPEDVQDACHETGLNKEQVQMWGKHFRFQHGAKPVDEILAYLRGEKEVRDQPANS